MKRGAVVAAVIAFAVAAVIAYHTTQARADSRTVALGARGPAVTQVQVILAANGYTVAVDGRFGPQTLGAVKAWQAAHRLVVDGIVGPVTWGTLRPAVRLSPPPAPTPEQIIRTVWPDELENHAVAIAYRESRLVPTVRNACCFGLFQINWNAHRHWLTAIGITSPQQLFDPLVNASVALALYQQAGWQPWTL